MEAVDRADGTADRPGRTHRLALPLSGGELVLLVELSLVLLLVGVALLLGSGLRRPSVDAP